MTATECTAALDRLEREARKRQNRERRAYIDRLDTRPDDRREQARVRVLDLAGLIGYALDRGDHIQAGRLLAESRKAWAWRRMWDEAAVRR